MGRCWWWRGAGIFGFWLSCALAYGTWNVVNLHPPGASASSATGVAGGRQVGIANFSGIDRAVRWSGSAGTWQALNMSGIGYSSAWGIVGETYVGNAPLGTFQHAAIWTEGSSSWIDLTPAHATAYTSAYGTDGVQQVGVTYTNNLHRASLWTGSAASWVDLSGGRYSDAFDVHNGVQVGTVNLSVGRRASLWRGSAASWVNLHPLSGYFRSDARGVYGEHQVGTAVAPGNLNHGGIWSGTAESWRALTPAGATESQAEDIFENRQVGSATIGGAKRASMWSGSAESWIDLHAFLPSSFSSSFADSISREGDTWSIAGYGYNEDTHRKEALMWIATVPEPGIAVVLTGGLIVLRKVRRRSLNGKS